MAKCDMEQKIAEGGVYTIAKYNESKQIIGKLLMDTDAPVWQHSELQAIKEIVMEMKTNNDKIVSEVHVKYNEILLEKDKELRSVRDCVISELPRADTRVMLRALHANAEVERLKEINADLNQKLSEMYERETPPTTTTTVDEEALGCDETMMFLMDS
jgi:hypothetical protein